MDVIQTSEACYDRRGDGRRSPFALGGVDCSGPNPDQDDIDGDGPDSLQGGGLVRAELARQSLTSPSWLQEARDEPSGAKAIPLTWALCPFRISSSWPVSVSQRRITPDLPQVASESPVGSESHVEQLVALAADRPDDRQAGRVADRDHPGVVGRRKGRAIGHERECDQGVRAALRLQEPAGRGVPETDRLVVARRGESSTVRRERERADNIGVAIELLDAARRGNVPQADSPVFASSPSCPPAVASVRPSGAKATDRTDVLVARERLQEATGRTSQSRTLSSRVR